MNKLKRIARIQPADRTHSVGDGFRVKSMIPRDAKEMATPFLMLDYNEPWQVLPSRHPRGVGAHPHKGFETVTIIWSGEVTHEDSTGARGTIGPGDVQWMTAGSGILHKEYHAEAFSQKGGEFHVAQLWVNLPAANKNTPPAYQDIRNADIPVLELEDNSGSLRVIAGNFRDTTGPAKTFTPIQLWDVKLTAGGSLKFDVAEGDSLQIAVLSGHVMINDTQARGNDWVLMSPQHSAMDIESNNESHLLIMGGKPINEPIMQYGPFVMNTKEEITEAMEAFENGRFGALA